jgi:hypothetical protein
MALPNWQRTIVTDEGDVIPSAEISVIVEATGLDAVLFSDRAGVTSKANPFFTGSDGFAEFYAAPGEYRIVATGPGGSVTWRYEILAGQAAIRDVGADPFELVQNSDLGEGAFLDESDINDLIDTAVGSLVIPIGAPIARAEISGVTLPSLSSSLAAMDGQLISDAESPFDGVRLPNVNGEDVVLTLTFTADGGGSFATIASADRPAIAEHDWATGTGIAANTYVKSIDYATGEVILSDTAPSGSIEVTFTNEGRGIVGASVFGSVGDKMQKITGKQQSPRLRISVGQVNEGALFGDTSVSLESPLGTGTNSTTQALGFDSSLSPDARTSADTFGKTKTDGYKMKYYMRIK